MKELVVISGKGGTGKTSITASLSSLAENKVVADCDVDAADMHLILKPRVQFEEEFEGGRMAVIDPAACTSCGECTRLCRFDAIKVTDGVYSVKKLSCEGCNVCAHFCPVGAIEMKDKIAGKWFISDTRHGPFVHAAMNIAEENSGKLVTKVRQEAKKIAVEKGLDFIITDGSPGIGCPVIASITGADQVLIVTEPTVSGYHDMRRTVELISHFRIPGMVCINKYDLNMDVVAEIEEFCKTNGIEVIARVPYDRDFTRAMLNAQSIIEYSGGTTSAIIRAMWEKILSSPAVAEK
ncbi:MAG: (4Fe-4S)-binding protein [Spirochaetae bacterium HGW-Spirochaetae-1]|jgi:MinD superfamily P-loop ATPase|nr:MAG: (4Fe-4S)-binding protein [Spirochaetae bacterium HGW-Spirochaetae-1]